MYLTHSEQYQYIFYRIMSQQVGNTGFLFPLCYCSQKIAISPSLQKIMFATFSRLCYKLSFPFILCLIIGFIVVVPPFPTF